VDRIRGAAVIGPAARVRQALAQADLLLLAARVLSSPSDARLNELRVSEADLRALIAGTGMRERPRLTDTLRACLDLAQSTALVDWRREYTRLFDASVACPINETAYVRRDKGAVMEFAAMLLIMLAQACQDDDENAARITDDALRAFLGDHLAEWLTPFCRRLADATSLPLYVRAAMLLQSTWEAMAEALNLPISPPLWPGGPGPDDEGGGTPYECGMAEAEQGQPIALTGPPGSGLPRPEEPPVCGWRPPTPGSRRSDA
jgi:nitrate reductase assembly molybdenum cofactor insertion protein NarJ